MKKGKQRIAFVQPGMGYGGIEKVLVNLLKALDYNRANVDLYLMYDKGELFSQIPSNVNVKVLRMDMSTKARISCLAQKRDFLGLLRVWILKGCLLFVPWDSNAGKNIRMKMSHIHIGHKYDKVIAFHYTDDFTRLFALDFLKGKKKMIWIHGSVGLDTCQNLFDRFDEIIAVSQSIETIFLEKFPKNKGKTKVLYNLLDMDDILAKSNDAIDDMKPDSLSIVSVGRLSEEKGFQLIPQVAHKLNEDGYQFDWYIIGNGTLFETISHECNDLSVHNVHLLGSKSNPYPYMKRCTLYVQPSFSEGYCTTTNEAKLLCKPIIATDVSGMREQFIHETNAYIVANPSVNELYEAVKYLLEHDELREKYIINLINNGINQQEHIAAINNALGLTL